MASDKKDRAQRKCSKCGKGMLCCSEKDLQHAKNNESVKLRCNSCYCHEDEKYKNLIG
ncbi:hypothetical protein [Helicobacter cetorum]|uniref:hypothetical protein n=1 Tax=Helicobacter cetorum TaxID=138563 RepID=UPI0012DD0394|nr:hypothetical protein [Helicobacter cetorum]